MSTSSFSCADNQEFLVSAVSTVPKAEITEVEITHSIKTERKLQNLWHYLERKKGSSFPTAFGVGFKCLCIHQLLRKKSKQKIYFITFLFSIKCVYTHKILTHLMNMRWLFSSKVLKSRGTNTRSFIH